MAMRWNSYRSSFTLCIACLAVGILAARGTFTSAMGFPLIFGLVCLVLGVVSLVRDRPRDALFGRAAILMLGVAVAVGGWWAQGRLVRERMATAEQEVSARLVGKPAPLLSGLEPLNTEPAILDQAASFKGKATIITFWARWCSPCEKEMPELEELYRQHRDRGLRVVAVTRYGNPDDAEERQSDVAKAKSFLSKRGLTYPAAITAEDAVYRGYEVWSIPRTALIDGEGTLVAYGVGLKSARSLMGQAVTMVGGNTEP